VLMASNDYGARDAVIVLVGQDGIVSAGHVARLQAILWKLIALLPPPSSLKVIVRGVVEE